MNITFDAPDSTGGTELFIYINEQDNSGNGTFDIDGIFYTGVPGTYCVTHNTQFAYAIAQPSGGYHWARLYDSPIVYVLIFFDLYLLATLVMGVLRPWEIKPKKETAAIHSS